jgi:RNA polymerase sigma factor (sigma-70 family)
MDEVELRVQLERVHADCFGWAMACCNRDRDDAEEVLQTVYLSVLDGHARFDARSSFRTWIFGVIRRTAASERRKAWMRGMLLEREAGSGKREAGGLFRDVFEPPDGTVERESRADRLHRADTCVRSRSRQRRRAIPRLRPHVVAMAAAVVIATVWLANARLFSRPSVTPTIATIVAWRAPTDVLLRTPGSELLGTMPALGASVLDKMISTPSNRGT